VGTEEVNDSMASACQTQKRDVALDPSLWAYSAMRWFLKDLLQAL
jgi:hypothetical protein